jgi:hypothetical protein
VSEGDGREEWIRNDGWSGRKIAKTAHSIFWRSGGRRL